MPMRQRATPPTGTRLDIVLLSVPVLAAMLGILGLEHALTLRTTGSGHDLELLFAIIVAGACLAVAGWWVGGLLMLSLAYAARRLRWRGVEHWATRLTPALVARTAVALVGVQLVVVAPAHAEETAFDPFWAPATAGIEQLAEPPAPGAAPQTPVAADAPESPASPLVPPTDMTAPGAAAPTDAATPGTRAAAAGPSVHPSTPPAQHRVTDGVLTVMAGDSLWDLTHQLLGPGATDATVCENLPAWLELNTVAHHGDLIRPGDQLRVPHHLLDSAATPH